MKLKILGFAVSAGCCLLAPVAAWSAGVKDFYVRNAYADAVMTGLEISADGKKNWSRFELKDGIKPSAETKIIWRKDAVSEMPGKQFLRARFANGGISQPLAVDLCKTADQRFTFGQDEGEEETE